MKLTKTIGLMGVFIFWVYVLTFGCAGQEIKQSSIPQLSQYQTIYPLYELLTQAANSVYRIYTLTIVKFDEDGETRELEILGNAFAIDNYRLLTAYHVVSQDEYYVDIGFGGIRVFIDPENKVKEESQLILDDGSLVLANVIYKDKELDFAVLEVKDRMSLPIYSIGDSDDFHVLDQAFIIANTGRGEGMKAGHIMQLDFIEYEKIYKQSKCNEDMFGLSLPIKHGDSGAPIFLICGNRLEVGGLVSLGDIQGTGYGIKINSIMDRFKIWQNER